MNKDTVLIGISYNIKTMDVIVVDSSMKILSQDHHTFETLAGMNALMKETADYSYRLPQEIRKSLGSKNKFLYSFRICTTKANLLLSGGISINKIDPLYKQLMLVYYQLLGIIRWCLLKNDIQITYYQDTFLNAFFTRSRNYSPAATKLSLYTQWRRAFRNAGMRLAFCLCLVEKVRLFVVGGRVCEGYNKDQRKLIKSFIDKPEEPEAYEFLLE